MDYTNGQIYCIRNKIDNLIYIGSTCSPLFKRFHNHKKKVNIRSSKVYQHMKDIGIDKFYIELVESFPCNNKNELRAKEQYYCRFYDTFKNGLNQLCASVDDIRINEKKKYIKERNNKSYILNKNSILKQCKQYYVLNKDKINSKIKCDNCNIELLKRQLKKHYKTKKHIKNSQLIN
jgi:hypothetical protein